jgi:hypothetical protein
MYGVNENNFYYNYLMVYGGIFPTFPEPEHGKTWLLPWQFEIIEQTESLVSIKMSFTDNLAASSNVPEDFNSAPTGLRCEMVVSLDEGKSSLDIDFP